jgi:hypothetical protein
LEERGRSDHGDRFEVEDGVGHLLREERREGETEADKTQAEAERRGSSRAGEEQGVRAEEESRQGQN